MPKHLASYVTEIVAFALFSILGLSQFANRAHGDVNDLFGNETEIRSSLEPGIKARVNALRAEADSDLRRLHRELGAKIKALEVQGPGVGVAAGARGKELQDLKSALVTQDAAIRRTYQRQVQDVLAKAPGPAAAETAAPPTANYERFIPEGFLSNGRAARKLDFIGILQQYLGPLQLSSAQEPILMKAAWRLQTVVSESERKGGTNILFAFQQFENTMAGLLTPDQANMVRDAVDRYQTSLDYDFISGRKAEPPSTGSKPDVLSHLEKNLGKSNLSEDQKHRIKAAAERYQKKIDQYWGQSSDKERLASSEFSNTLFQQIITPEQLASGFGRAKQTADVAK